MIAKIFGAAVAVAALSSALPNSVKASASPDMAKGRTAFRACAACHSDKPGVTRLGPSLAGMFNQPAGEVEGFRYSPALAKANLRWDRKTLDAFIAKPKAVVPGNRMSYPGVADPAKRAAIIDYLQSLR